VLTFEELTKVVLVGHSYAGMVVTGVADRADGRVHSLVYLDAFVPGDGRSLIDYVTASDRRDGRIKAEQAGGYLHPMSVEALGITNPQDQAWVRRRVTLHPYATSSQPLRFRRDGGARVTATIRPGASMN
jgi:pimeloyl-ACP methyl ester carboxylesterase